MEDIFALVPWTDMATYVLAGVGGMIGIDLLFTGGKMLKRLLRRS